MTARDAGSMSRRRMLQAAGGLAMLPLLGAAPLPPPRPLKQRKTIRLAYLSQAVCVAPVVAAKSLGYFDHFNLDVELVGYDFHTEAFIKAPTDGTVDAGVAMLQNWMLPMAEGLPVKLIAAIHGGCVRILGSRKAGVTRAADLRGQRLGVPGGKVNKLATMVYSIILLRHGIDPKDVSFVPVENEDFGKAFADGSIAAAAGVDPPLLMLEQHMPDLIEVASNMTGPMAGTACCVVAAGPSLWRDDRQAAVLLSNALALGSDWTQTHPVEAAALSAKVSSLPQDAVRQSLSRNNYHSHHIAGTPRGLRSDVQLFAEGLRTLTLLPADMDPARFAADHVDQAICA